MAKTLNRKKPGYTKNGEVRIVSLSVKQLTELKEKTQANKKQAKIQRRIDLLKRRPGYKEPAIGMADQISPEQS
jgi:hypothetical protein